MHNTIFLDLSPIDEACKCIEFDLHARQDVDLERHTSPLHLSARSLTNSLEILIDPLGCKSQTLLEHISLQAMALMQQVF